MSFSDNFRKLTYRQRLPDAGLNAKIFHLIFNGETNRGIARALRVSEHCVRRRIARMSQRALAFQSGLLKKRNLRIREDVAYDGFESYAISQYDPNNINHVVGRDTLFIYDYNFAGLNRKGRMSPWQRQRLAEIEAEFGRYDPTAIRLATASILARAHERSAPAPLRLLSDEHFQYRRAIRLDLADRRYEHLTVSSKACRNFQNILFSVNHADLLIRQRISAFEKETISFAKSPGAMCRRYALFMIHKNYMAPQFTKRLVRRPRAHVESPAQALGLAKRILKFRDIFGHRSLPDDSRDMNRDWWHFYRGEVPPEFRRHPRFCRRPSDGGTGAPLRGAQLRVSAGEGG